MLDKDNPAHDHMPATTVPGPDKAQLYAALAAAQGAFPPIAKNREVEIVMRSGGKYKFRYADLEAVISATRKPLADNGLALFQILEEGYLRCTLAHSSGATISSRMGIPDAAQFGDDPKGYGARITYLRRYLVTAILGVAADDDLDENGQEPGDGNPQNHEPQNTKGKPSVDMPRSTKQKPALERAQQQESSANPPADTGADRPASQGEFAYLIRKLTGEGAPALPDVCAKAKVQWDGQAELLTLSMFQAIKAVL